MRKVHQKIILTFSFVLCSFFIHKTWRKHHFFTVSPQYSSLDSQEHRKATIRSVCERNNLTGSSFALDHKVATQLYVEHNHKFIYCEVPKVGCSNWKRIILSLDESLGLTINELKHYEVHSSKLLTKLSSYPPSIQKVLLANYTKVMFTRDPIERVISAYRDKFLHDDDVYYRETVTNQIRSTLGISSKTNITFEQFARFIIKENPYYRDTHWKPMYQLCDPCRIQYDVIGKFDTLVENADFVLRTIRAPPNLNYPAMKHHSNDSRTNHDISISYLEMLPPTLLRRFINVYSLDFIMFDYEYYNSHIFKIPKTI